MTHTLFVSCVLSACAQRGHELTELVVLVGGDEAIDSLDVKVLDGDGAHEADRRAFDLTRVEPMRLPTSFTVVPAAGYEDARVRLVVRGFATDRSGARRALARTEVIASFSRGRTTLLPIVLGEACADQPCGCPAFASCDMTCEAHGEAHCARVRSYARGVLPEIMPGDELEVISEGGADCPRGSFPGPDGACEDVDECAFFVDACQLEPHACVNLPMLEGRYRCACPAGYTGTGVADDPCMPAGSDESEGT